MPMKRHFYAEIATLLAILCSQLPGLGRESIAGTVAFRYSPPEWQTAICLPDDPEKTLVDRGGDLLYHYNRGGREFGTRVSLRAAEAVWQSQELFSPRVPIVRTHRVADGLEIVEEAFAVTDLPRNPKVNSPAGSGGPDTNRPARNDLILVRVTNTSGQARTLRPQLVVDTTLPFSFDLEKGQAQIEGHEIITASLKMTGMAEERGPRRAIQLAELSIAAGQSATFFALYSAGRAPTIAPGTTEQALASRRHAVEFWGKAPLPYGRVEVPDAGIQALVDSSIRNIWQAREIKKGLPAFQVGPTCYRGLWIVDGAFLLEAAAMLGAGDQARNGVAYELTHQKPDGRIEVMQNYWKENGIVLWTCVRHAQLTQDKAWLESRVAEARADRPVHQAAPHSKRWRTTRRWTTACMPAGFPDGGIGGVHV